MSEERNLGGRPRIPENQKVRRVQISLPPKTHEKGKRKAKRAGKTFSAWLADLIERN